MLFKAISFQLSAISLILAGERVRNSGNQVSVFSLFFVFYFLAES